MKDKLTKVLLAKHSRRIVENDHIATVNLQGKRTPKSEKKVDVEGREKWLKTLIFDGIFN